MTMWTETGFPILTVIVIAAAIYLLFSACEEKTKAYRKYNYYCSGKHGIRLYKCLLARELALPWTLCTGGSAAKIRKKDVI